MIHNFSCNSISCDSLLLVVSTPVPGGRQISTLPPLRRTLITLNIRESEKDKVCVYVCVFACICVCAFGCYWKVLGEMKEYFTKAPPIVQSHKTPVDFMGFFKNLYWNPTKGVIFPFRPLPQSNLRCPRVSPLSLLSNPPTFIM